MYGFVYMTTNNINGMKYIGMHKSDDMNDNYLGSGVALHKAIKQYGKENFTRIILDTAEDYDELSRKEIYYISKFDANHSKEFYNHHSGGYGGSRNGVNPNYGNYWSDEQKAALSKKRKLNGLTKGKLNGMYGCKDKNALNGKMVYIYDDKMNLIHEFETRTMALRFLNLKGHTQFNRAIDSNKLFHNYFIFTYKV